MISSWVTDAAPWRCAVPRQSAPVSPPPMITTCLPRGGDGRSLRPRSPAWRPPVGRRQVLHGLVDAVQVARRAPAGRGPRWRRRPARSRRIGPQLAGGDVRADVDAAAELGALGPHLVQAPVQVPLLHLELGDAVAEQAAGRSARSNTVTVVPGPGELLGGGQPGGPGADHGDPLAGARPRGGCGATQPSAQARSMISTSTCLIVTGSALMPSTQAASHGAGQSRPVNSGKLLVACSRSDGLAPVVPVDQVVPLRDQVAQRAAVVAERDAAVHAPAGLPLQLGLAGNRLVDLAPVAEPHVDRAPGRRLPRRVQEALGVSHDALLRVGWLSRCAAAMTASSTSRPSRSAPAGGSSTRL